MKLREYITKEKGEKTDWQIACQLLDFALERAVGLSSAHMPDTPEIDSFRHQFLDVVGIEDVEEQLSLFREIIEEMRADISILLD
jgi:hypothetical protein